MKNKRVVYDSPDGQITYNFVARHEPDLHRVVVEFTREGYSRPETLTVHLNNVDFALDQAVGFLNGRHLTH